MQEILESRWPKDLDDPENLGLQNHLLFSTIVHSSFSFWISFQNYLPEFIQELQIILVLQIVPELYTIHSENFSQIYNKTSSKKIDDEQKNLDN